MTQAPSLSVEEFRRLGHAAVDLMADYLAGVPGRAVFTPMSPEARRQLLEGALPEHGRAPEDILAAFTREVLPYGMGNGHPRFFGWVNSPPAPVGIVGEFLAAAMDPSCAGGDHAAIYLERRVVRWLMELVGFPVDGSMGLLVSGASMATLTCLAAARQRAATADGWDVRASGLSAGRPPLVIYASDQGHSCIHKVLGGRSALRACVLHYATTEADLAELVDAVQEAGRRLAAHGA
jgi:glutamate/tyrosine decarboxylase-like PLP-dependent enzyme